MNTVAANDDARRSHHQSLFLAFVLGLTVGSVWTSYLLLWSH